MDGENTEWTCNHLRSEGTTYSDTTKLDTRTFYCALTGKFCIGTKKNGRIFTGKEYDNDVAEKNCPAYSLPVNIATIVRKIALARAKSELEKEVLEISG